MVKKKLVCKTLKSGNKQWVACFGNKTTKPKAKTITIKRKKKAKPTAKPKPKTKLMSGGKAVLMGLPINMKTIGSYAISKTEKARRVKLAEKRINSYETRIYVFSGRDVLERYKPSREILNFGHRSIFDGERVGRTFGPLKHNRPSLAMTKKLLKKGINMKKKYEEIRNNFKSVVGRQPRAKKNLTTDLDDAIKLLEKHMKHYNSLKKKR
tara:strand:- start:3793 stop:4422 length:630 start_codon:yes stop_codon:yes gene_type:complete